MALTFGVFTPANSNGAAVLNMVSGGWRSGWRRHDVSQRQYQAVLDKGFTAFAVRHGSSPKFVIPKIVPDVRRAVRYVRLNARRLRVDPNRLAARGGSAGGHLSLMLDNTSDGGDPSSEGPVLRMSNRVAAVVAYCPPVDLRPLAHGLRTLIKIKLPTSSREQRVVPLAMEAIWDQRACVHLGLGDLRAGGVLARVELRVDP